MKDLIKEVALDIANKLDPERAKLGGDFQFGFNTVQLFGELVVAELTARAEASCVAFQHEDTGRTTSVAHDEADDFERLNQRWFKVGPLFTFPPIHDIEIIGLKELLEEVQKADDALSAGDKNEALIKVRTAWVAASIVKQHTRNRKLFKPLDIAEVENRVAEACAKFAESRSLKESDDTEEIDMWDMANISIAEAIRSGAWRKYK